MASLKDILSYDYCSSLQRLLIVQQLQNKCLGICFRTHPLTSVNYLLYQQAHVAT